MDRTDPKCKPGEAYRTAAFPQVHQWHNGLNGRLAALARLTPEAPIVAYAVTERAALLDEVMTVQRRWDAIVWTGDDTTRARLRLQMQKLRFDQDQLDSQVNVALKKIRRDLNPDGVGARLHKG